jgi:tRNA-dihydrouridine synthase
MVAVHWRYASQGFRPDTIDWSVIRKVKESVQSIPVLGNGDVHTAVDVARMLRETGCDGVMIGRAAAGHPWLFRQIAHELRAGEAWTPPSIPVRAGAALEHAQVMVETSDYGEAKTVLELRGRLHQYFDEFIDTDERLADLRYRLVRVNCLADIEALVLPLIEGDFDSDR